MKANIMSSVSGLWAVTGTLGDGVRQRGWSRGRGLVSFPSGLCGVFWKASGLDSWGHLSISAGHTVIKYITYSFIWG